MKLNNKGFAITSVIYSMLILFLTLVVLIISNLASRKAIFDKQKDDIMDKFTLGIENGTVVYFDVSGGTQCTFEDYALSYDSTVGDYMNSIAGYNGIDKTSSYQNSCLKFYVFNDDGESSLNLLLDHNTTIATSWNSAGTLEIDLESGALSALRTATDEWNGTNQPPNYYSDKYTIDYTGYKARLITAQEVAQITGADIVLGWDENNQNNEWYYLDGKYGSDSTWHTQIANATNPSKFWWLFDRTKDCVEFGCNVEDDNIYGYWTSSYYKNSSDISGIWTVGSKVYLGGKYINGEMDYADISSATDGIRPVIEVSRYNTTPDDTLYDECFEVLANGENTLTITGYKCSYDTIEIPSTIDGKTVTAIGGRAFETKYLSSVKLPNTLTTIESLAFHTNYLRTIVIPDSVVKIGERAFADNLLTSIDLPNSLTSIGDGAFARNFTTENKFIYNRNSDGTIDYTSLNSYAGANGTVNDIPSTVTKIGPYAFYFSRIKSITIPEGVTTIGEKAFAFNLLTSIDLPNSLTSIGPGAFARNDMTENGFIYNRNSDGSIDYTSLNSYAGSGQDMVVIPNIVENIGDYAFDYTLIWGVQLPDALKTIGIGAFKTNHLSSIDLPSGVTEIGSLAFYGNRLTTVTIPSGVTKIGTQVFKHNKLTSVIIEGKSGPSDFTTYGTNIFGWASGYSDANIQWNG